MNYMLCRLVGRGSVQYPLEGKPCLTMYQVLGHTRSARHNWVTTVKLHPHTGELPALDCTADDSRSLRASPSHKSSMIASAGRADRRSMAGCKSMLIAREKPWDVKALPCNGLIILVCGAARLFNAT